MSPISFECNQVMPFTGEQIAAEIAKPERWKEFKGYGILPGIADAKYEAHTPNMVGARMRVHSTDGSSYIEEFYVWEPTREISIKMHEFAPPLKNLATHITEEFKFETTARGTLVRRKVTLFPRHLFAYPMLWLISLFFREAIRRNLLELANYNNG